MKIIRSTFTVLLLLIGTITVKAQATHAGIDNVVTAYLDVKNALTADNGALAEAKAKVLYNQIANVQVKDQAAWKKYADKLSFDSHHMSETATIDHQREHFAALSKNLYWVLKELKANSKALYLEYCPMKKSSWLSDKATIENPYFGKSMPGCGSVKETLKATK